MKSAKLTDAEIRRLGWEALVERLGIAGALRFSLQTERGAGDYTAWRHTTMGSLTVVDLVQRMRKTTSKRIKR